MKSAEERKREAEEIERGNLIYRKVVHLNEPLRQPMRREEAHTESKGILTEAKDAIVHKLAEGVHAV